MNNTADTKHTSDIEQKCTVIRKSTEWTDVLPYLVTGDVVTVYVLHSQECLALNADLRDCPWSPSPAEVRARGVSR